MSDTEHTVTAMKEIRHIDGHDAVRWRGRCSCSATSYMHYSTAAAAKTAIRQTHLHEATEPERTNA
jgi:hypothetical protein